MSLGLSLFDCRVILSVPAAAVLAEDDLLDLLMQGVGHPPWDTISL